MPRKTRKKLTEAARPGITERRQAREEYEEARRTKPLGEGSRFRALAAAARAGGAKNPEAVAAMAGREAHGAKQMAEWAAAGRRRAAAKKQK
jgi:hypothetical protein